MNIIFHGELRERFGARHPMQSSTVADALEGLSRQLENFPSDMLVEVIGFDSPDKLNARTQVEEVHVVPAMFGGGGNFGKIIIGVILIAVAIFVPGIGAAVATSLIVSGSLMVLQGIIGLLMKAPTTDKVNDPPASKYLGNGKNTTAIGTPQTLAWGRVLLAGHFLSVQSDSNTLVLGTFPVTPT